LPTRAWNPEHYNYERVDVIVGCTYTDVVAAFIIIACAATLFVHGQAVNTAQDAAVALVPLAGKYASVLFEIGLLNASIFSAAVLPLSTAYAVSEGMGWESAVSRGLKEAPAFFGIYTALIVLGAGIILLPVKSLVQAMLDSQTLNGVLLPVILVVMLKLINNERLMGRFVNGKVINFLTWAVVIFVIALTLVLVAISVFPALLGA
jgi:Mn2+/Fe2+ NRAMP family transporter